MSEKRNVRFIMLFLLSVGMAAASLTTVVLSYYFSHRQYLMLDRFCGALIGTYPQSEQVVLDVLKAQETNQTISPHESFLSSFGYKESDFLYLNGKIFLAAGIVFLIGMGLFLLVRSYRQQQLENRIKQLTEYLEKINTEKSGVLVDGLEDEFSHLQDELYKTVTTLYQTRDAAVTAKKNYADNLFHIAHQLKTPITAISLSAQMMKKEVSSDYLLQIEKQLSRLTYLEESLLLLARIDAGTLTMKRDTVDVFTLLTLAADNLQELFIQKCVAVDIPELGAVSIKADLEWTMEAVMNLLKNCMEHSPAGTAVHCSYEQNPLYVQIRIWDEGQGFTKADLPHLFERFYRGEHGQDTGVGIGLPLAKAIVEMQNGVISGENRPQGGACFAIRFYYNEDISTKMQGLEHSHQNVTLF